MNVTVSATDTGAGGDTVDASALPTRAMKVGEAHASFELPLACASAFPLFTPVGEQRWVAGWQPEMLHGDGLAPAIGDVFETQAHGRRFLWTVADLDPHAFRIVYVRVADGFQVGRVTVQCHATGAAASRIDVTYRLLGLGDEGAAHVEAFFAPGAYERFIATWPREITAALTREAGDQLPTPR